MPNSPDFLCLSLSPIELSGPWIALATARAGGVGLLDAEYCPAAALGVAGENLSRLLAAAEPGQAVGLRLPAGRIPPVLDQLLRPLARRPHWLVLTQWDPATLPELLQGLPACPGRTLLLDVQDRAQLAGLDPALVDGLVARGSESGGWVGEDSSFVLTQKLVAASPRPVYVQGGMGLHTAAACRAAGAVGVVLEETLYLMPESPFPASWREIMAASSVQDTRLVGEAPAVRVLERPGCEAVEALVRSAGQAECQDGDAWRTEAVAMLGWGEPGTHAWPVGQAIGLAKGCAADHRTVGRYLGAIQRHSREYVQLGRRLQTIAPDSPLARSHRTRYPIVQGPMTRVSDSAAFALAVAEAGALPMLALALMEAPAVERLLSATRQLLGDRPWGVGVLGFVPRELREAQLEVVRRIRPDCVLIAGGRPDQALELESQGLPTYLHAPTPGLTRLFLERGARRLVFEGRECGGHVGPLSSFVLWESVVQVILETLTEAESQDLHVLFAGGIHDGRSAGMVESLAAPLAARGVKVGVLVGTAYLFTREAVATGAIVEGFQRQAIDCERTVNLETGPGHASRCAVTPFAATFRETRRQLRAEGQAAGEISRALDALCLGRLRVAAKGVTREDGRLVAIDPSTQLRDGMYMIGQVATMHREVLGMDELHRALCERPAQPTAAPLAETEVVPSPSDIAIVGIGTILPKADSPQAFWHNILHQIDAISEIPPARWDWQTYYDPDPKTPDKSYSKWGCFIDPIPFDPARFGIPPRSLPSIDPIQLLSLEAVRRALEDAGYARGDFDRENTSVILGYSGGLGELGERYVARVDLSGRLAAGEDRALDGLPEWTEDSFPGLLPNVSAGRVANRFDLGGANFTVDAACASSLTAIDVAVAQLESGRCNLAIAGGVDTKLSPFGYLCFSKTPAMTPRDHARPFDRAADGILLGEGVAMVVLKRLADAESDGDRIYAVIKAAASSSDGKALGLTAPRSSGQLAALRRAYRKAGFDPGTIGFYEAHGTGTKLGDETELQTIHDLLSAGRADPKSCAVGSVKALIGHTKSTAGVAALVKAALALHHRVLPPQPRVTAPLERLADPESPLYLLQTPEPWRRTGDRPRRAGVSAFGFGGTNCHCVLEEYQWPTRPMPCGDSLWPHELVLFAAPDRAALVRELDQLAEQLAAAPGSTLLADLARDRAGRARRLAGRPAERLAIVAEDVPALTNALALARQQLTAGGQPQLPPQIRIGSADSELVRGHGKVALLFPGQGAQYLDMAREVALFFDLARDTFESAERELAASLPRRLGRYIFPPGLFTEAETAAATQALTATAIAQPAIGTVETAYWRLLSALGLRPDMVGGHSYGEYAALHAAGVLSFADFLRLSRIRGQSMAAASQEQGGTMAAISAPRDQVEGFLTGTGVVIANHNAPSQTVISGRRDAVERVLGQIQAAGVKCTLLPVAGAFHSRLMADSQGPLEQAIGEVPMAPPVIPVFSNIDARPYPADVGAIRQQLSRHLLSPVEFVSQIESMYEAGARCFVEVGPKGILTGLTGQILQGRPHLAVAVDGNGGGLRGLLIALGTLFVQGAELDWSILFAGRVWSPATADQTGADGAAGRLQWFVDGGGVRQTAQAPARPPVARLAVVPAGGRPGVNSTEEPIMSRTRPDDLQPVPMSAAAPGARPAVGAAVAAYQSYQATMQQFLAVQERVMSQFMTGAVAAPLSREFTAAAGATPVLESLPGATCEALAAPLPSAPIPPVTAPAPAPALEVRAALGRDGLVSILLAVVADCTGYPTEMLGLDQGLEAELGIDSIKRVEILAGVEKRLPPELAGAMSAHMEAFNQVKTLNQLADLLEQWAPAAAAAPGPTDVGATAAVPPSASALTRDELLALIIGVVADCTGYPPEMLGLDQDLEAELGIDSIKRVEILAGVEKRLPPELAGAMSTRMEAFNQIKTLGSLAALILEPSAGPAGAVPAAAVAAPALVTAAAPAQPTIDRYVMRSRPAPLDAASRVPIVGLVLVTRDDARVAELLVARLGGLGVAAAVLDEAAMQSPDSIAAAVAELRGRHGPVSALVHLAGVARQPMPADLADWHRVTAREIKGFFHLIQSCAEDLGSRPSQVLSVSRLGGHFGRNQVCGPALPSSAGNAGMLKTLALEWSTARTRAIDVDDCPDETLAALLLDELSAGDDETEVGYPGGVRSAFFAAREPLQGACTASVEPGPDWVVLALGGARGITAEVVGELLLPGMTLVLLGRNPEPGPESEHTAGITEVDALRRALIESARIRGERPTPAEINRELQRLARQREIGANLAAFRASGARVEYQAIDVNDGAALARVIDDLYQRFGRIDAVIQGVGVIEDKLLVDKTRASYDRVFDTKVDSTYLLCRHLRPETLKLALLFASVAGRTGNRGQSDYAAANEVINRFGWWMREHWPRTRVVSINWGPWDATGMASEEVNRQFRERGVIPIPPAAGRRFVREELRYGRADEVELVAGLFAGAGSSAGGTTPGERAAYPLLVQPPQVRADGALTLDYRFSLAHAPYLDDHRLDGAPVVPAAVAMELMAEFVQAAWPDWVVTEVRDLRVLNGLVLQDERDLEVRLLGYPATHADGESHQIEVEIQDPASARARYRATLVLRLAASAPLAYQVAPLTAGRRVDAAAAYAQHCFHGPRFQRLTGEGLVAAQGVDWQLVPSVPTDWVAAGANAGWILDPGVVDALLQTVILWSRLEQGTYPLPTRFRQVLVHGALPAGRPLRLTNRVTGCSATAIEQDFCVWNERDELVLQLLGVEASHSAALNRLAPSGPDSA